MDSFSLSALRLVRGRGTTVVVELHLIVFYMKSLSRKGLFLHFDLTRIFLQELCLSITHYIYRQSTNNIMIFFDTFQHEYFDTFCFSIFDKRLNRYIHKEWQKFPSISDQSSKNCTYNKAWPPLICSNYCVLSSKQKSRCWASLISSVNFMILPMLLSTFKPSITTPSISLTSRMQQIISPLEARKVWKIRSAPSQTNLASASYLMHKNSNN